MAKNLLKFELREGTGKSVTRKLRREGKIPAVIYGRGEESTSVTVKDEDFKDLLAHLRGKLLIAELESPSGEKFSTAIKSIQRHPLTDEFLNIDFQKVHSGEMIHVSIPITTHGTPAGLKLGGVLEHVRYEVDVRGPVAKLPLNIDLDISDLNVGNAIRVQDLKFEEGVEVLVPLQSLIVSVITPRKERAVAVTEGAEGLEEGTGEAGEGEPEGAAEGESKE